MGTRLQGTSLFDDGNAITVSERFLFVAGLTGGNLGGQNNTGGLDKFERKMQIGARTSCSQFFARAEQCSSGFRRKSDNILTQLSCTSACGEVCCMRARCTEYLSVELGECPANSYAFSSSRLAHTSCNSIAQCTELGCFARHRVSIVRDACNPNGAFGRMFLDSGETPIAYTLEPSNLTQLLLAMSYRATFRLSGRLKYVNPYLLNRDTRREWILIHSVNTINGTEGCILVADNVFRNVGVLLQLSSSQIAFNRLVRSGLGFNSLLHRGTASQRNSMDPLASASQPLSPSPVNVLVDYGEDPHPIEVEVREAESFSRVECLGLSAVERAVNVEARINVPNYDELSESLDVAD